MRSLQTLRHTLWTLRQNRPNLAARERRLRQLLRFAAEHSPFYGRKFAGLDLARCPLSALPTTTKAEVMAQFDDVVTDRAVRREDVERFVDNPDNVGRFLHDRYPVCHTSGSQGQPLLVVQEPLALDLVFALQMTRGNVRYRNGPVEAMRRLIEPARLAIVISRPGFFASAWVWRHLPPAMAPFIKTLYVPGNDPDLIAKLREFRPTALTSTPTTLDFLAPRAPEFKGRLQQVTTWSETLTPAARQRIREAYGVPVLDTYGCGECLFLTTGCRTRDGSHVNADWAILENVDEMNRPVPAGETGHHVLLTNLANRVQPLTRYEVGDQLRMAVTPCDCGNPLPRIEHVQGRTGDVVWVRVGHEFKPLSAYPFQHAFEHLREVREWQAVQRDRNAFQIRFELLPGASLDLARARDRLNERLELVGFGRTLTFDMTLVPRLETDGRTGKFRRLVSEIGPPA